MRKDPANGQAVKVFTSSRLFWNLKKVLTPSTRRYCPRPRTMLLTTRPPLTRPNRQSGCGSPISTANDGCQSSKRPTVG